MLVLFLSLSYSQYFASQLTMNRTQVMISILFFTICICVVTSTDNTVTRNLDKKTSDVFRQMLNQETIIRLTFTKTIDDMMKDMQKQRQIIASLQTDVKNMKTESDLLRQENKLLKEQLSQHHSSVSKLNNTMQILNGHIENIRENVSDITIHQKSFAKEITLIARELGNRTSSSIDDLKTELRYASVTLLNLEKDTRDHKENIHKMIDNHFKSLSEAVNSTIGNMSMDALKMYLSDEVNSAMKDMNVNILQTQNQQLRLANDIAALKLFRMNVSNSITEPRQRVGFTAGITSGNSGWTGTVLVFPKLIYSVGGGYDASTGIFTSPKAGLFVFYVSVQSYHTKFIGLQIMLNDTAKVETLAYSATYAAHSNLAVLQLQKGDRVYVKRSAGTGYNSISVPRTTFSGFML